jgi:uncharacterized membrane protein
VKAWIERFKTRWTEGIIIVFAIGLALAMAALVSAVGGWVLGSLWGLIRPDEHNVDNAGFIVALFAVPYWIGYVIRIWINQEIGEVGSKAMMAGMMMEKDRRKIGKVTAHRPDGSLIEP